MKSDIKIVIGSHGSGKSNFIYEQLIKLSRKSDGKIDLNKKIYLVVPEQDTNDKQRLMMQKSKILGYGAGIFNIDVISFDRMAHNVFDILDIEPLKENVIDDDIKTMILAYVLSKLGREQKLKYSAKMVGKIGFAKKLTKAMSEFYAYNVTDADLDAVIGSTNSDLYRDKLSDLKLIFNEFKTVLTDLNFSIKEDKYDLLNKRISDVDIFNDAIVAFDGFTGFTPIQIEILKKIANVASKIYITIDMRNPKEISDLTIDDELKKTDVFYLSKKFVKDIMNVAGVHTVEKIICEDSIKEGNIKYTNGSERNDLKFIENNIYNTKNTHIEIPEIENIDYFVADNIRDETRNAANYILNLVRNSNYKYSDIKIMVPNIDNYRNIIIKQFREYNIPLFIDDTESILTSPYVEAVRAAIDVVNYNFSYESVMRYFSSGIISKNSEIYTFSNYIFIHNIRGYNRYKDEMKKNKSKTLSSVFSTYMSPLLFLYDDMMSKDKSMVKYISAISKFISDMKFNAKLFYLAKNIASGNDNVVESDENYKIDNDNKHRIIDFEVKNIEDKKIISILNYSSEVLKETIENLKTLEEYRSKNELNNSFDDITVEDFKRVFDVGLTSKGLKSIPNSLDAVEVGDLTRTRFDNPKTMLFLGLNQSAIPAMSSDTNLIDDTVRDLFLNTKELSQTTIETALNQRFYIYLALTNPTDKLVLSWSKTNSDDMPDEKSSVLISLENIFKQNTNEESDNKKSKLQEKKVDISDLQLYTNKDVVSFVAENLNDIKKLNIKDADGKYVYEYDEESLKRIVKAKKLLRYLRMKDNYESDFKPLLNNQFIINDVVLNDNLNNDLLKRENKDFVGSATTIEKFNKCHYKFFMEEILKLKDKTQYDVKPYDIGTMSHSVFEHLFSDKNFLNEEKEKQSEKINKEIDTAFANFEAFNEFDENSDVYLDGINKFKYIKGDIRDIIHKSADVLIALSKASNAKTDGVEEEFEFSIGDDGKEKILVNGKVDRIDVYSKDDKIYVNVVDYKSGLKEKKLDLKELKDGVNIQLTLYIDYCLNQRQYKNINIGANSKPIFTGTFYFWIADTFCRNEDLISDKDFEIAQKSVYGYNGLVNSNEEDLDNVFSGIIKEKNSKNKILNIKTTDGYKVAGTFISPNELDGYIVGMHNVAIKSIKDIKKGVITAKPNVNTLCRYCDYKDICHKEQLNISEEEENNGV